MKILSIDEIVRSRAVTLMDNAGRLLSEKECKNSDHGSLSLNGVDKMDAMLKELNAVAVRLGSMIRKDAKILDTIAQDFKKLDQSASKP